MNILELNQRTYSEKRCGLNEFYITWINLFLFKYCFWKYRIDEKAGHQQGSKARHPDPSRRWLIGTLGLSPGGLPEATPTLLRRNCPTLAA
ncbi:MAG: hypothetical protein ACTIKR_11130 [Advenella sp.]|uniref:hypothetical protein n=1 Tax=unclassified Advenella TaxID=2685285 RepID=UPI0018696892|nr:hypothetical protein [Advenella sp. FME57]